MIEGSLLEDSEQIKDHVVEFYSNLFKTLPENQDEKFFNLEGPSVSEQQNVFLAVVSFPSEIIEAVFSLKKNNSPGPDGFSRVFYTLAGNIIEKDVVATTTHFFH